jgi:dTDP-4-dehydrorhamnose reductase
MTFRVAVTGASGRLGAAVVGALQKVDGWQAIPWSRAEFDLDRPEAIADSLRQHGPDVVVHCAAWTDVDGCAREPELANQRNGVSTGRLAEACRRAGTRLAIISTNEVFDGSRTDGLAYRATDEPRPGNPYGRSKLMGEELAASALGGPEALWTLRTAWLFGPPGRDFPMKILEAGRQALTEQRPLKLVADEVGSPTLASDVASAVVDLLRHEGSEGLYHVTNPGVASRAEWARMVLQANGVDVATEDVPLATWPRPSTPPRWGVLEPTPLPGIGLLPPWQVAVSRDLVERFGIPAHRMAYG